MIVFSVKKIKFGLMNHDYISFAWKKYLFCANIIKRPCVFMF